MAFGACVYCRIEIPLPQHVLQVLVKEKATNEAGRKGWAMAPRQDSSLAVVGVWWVYGGRMVGSLL